MNVFLCLSCISLGPYKKCQKWGFEKKKFKRGGSHTGRLSIEEGFKPSAKYGVLV